MSITIINKDSERTWMVCHNCGKAWDARRASTCTCGNVRTEVDRRGAVYIEADDSDALEYDNSK
jgi:hypothetical protein